jgi:hypothetical protein
MFFFCSPLVKHFPAAHLPHSQKNDGARERRRSFSVSRELS